MLLSHLALRIIFYKKALKISISIPISPPPLDKSRKIKNVCNCFERHHDSNSPIVKIIHKSQCGLFIQFIKDLIPSKVMDDFTFHPNIWIRLIHKFYFLLMWPFFPPYFASIVNVGDDRGVHCSICSDTLRSISQKRLHPYDESFPLKYVVFWYWMQTKNPQT